MRKLSIARAATAFGSVAAITLGGVLAGGSPASAVPNCPSGHHCAFKNVQGGSQRHDYFNSDPSFTNDLYSGGGGVVNDSVSAASNSSTGGYESHYYRDVNYVGFLFCVNPNRQTDQYLPAASNDKASSLLLRGTTNITCFNVRG
ncbi:peptidase inhibitor family I36 protein [Streptomyces roseirectus]|uniref:Peptidase inhibitor family I36 protein n=1 Tax=Streptomyces roseirectus TaxID=2768066 RepID=A0A7H0IPJ7_9ACTN|nr:peptidase inhibitor family I36 protein [Streptomyces roseirectus]QNP74713.1 peptidase inhibitor family I36 protein [Streptomyces roseirectus]